jgi:hypothetical protein
MPATTSSNGTSSDQQGTTLGRRATLLTSVAGLAGCVAVPGQAAAQGVPCAERGGDIVGLSLEGRGAPAGSLAVFGQVFRPGDLPRDRSLLARQGDGRPVPAQLDVTSRHADGSAKFGIVSLAPAGALAPRQPLGVVLAAGPAPTERAAPLALAAALEGRQVLVEITHLDGGAPWRADLADLLRQPAARVPGAAWQDGPLAVQRRLSLRVPATAAGGPTSLRLVADVAVHADRTLWLDAWLRNDVAMQPGGGAARYTLRIVLDGREALRTTIPVHHQYTAWGRLLGVGPGGTAARPPAHVRHDAGYLADTGAVARYDLSVPVSEALLASYAQAVAAPAWAAPFSPRGITQYMPMSGGRADIGPIPLYQAAWLVSGDPRAAGFSIGQAEAAGAVPWHHWDLQGGGGAGGWLDVERWPALWTDGRGGAPPNGLMQPVPPSSATGWEHDHAHQPDLAFVPFILTGRRAFLDELQAQGAWNVVGYWPAPQARGNGEANLIRDMQVRGAAWALRQVHEAGWITPDADPQGAYFQRCERNNLRWLRSQIPAWTRAQGEAHGWVSGDFSQVNDLAPWQQDHLASTMIAMARKGDPDARAVLDFMANFLLGRFLSADKGFNPRDGVAYQLVINDAQKAPLRSWREVGDRTRAQGWSNGNGWARSQGNFAQVALTTLAGLVDLTDSPTSKAAYRWLAASGAPFTDREAFSKEPTYSVVPRSAAAARGCAAAERRPPARRQGG